jgi:hypothetical protein
MTWIGLAGNFCALTGAAAVKTMASNTAEANIGLAFAHVMFVSSRHQIFFV